MLGTGGTIASQPTENGLAPQLTPQDILRHIPAISGMCHVDALTSFANDIKANTAIIKRNENKWNLYLNDGTFKIYQNPDVLTKEFPSGFNAQEFILAVAGS